MNRSIFALVAAGLLPIAASAVTTISLDRPGVLEAIEADNPVHHQRIMGILRASQEMPCERENLERIAVYYDAREARCSAMVKTSLPAKVRLSFSLDGQAYVATVQLIERSRLVKVPTK